MIFRSVAAAGQIELNGSISDSSTTSTGDLNVSGNGSVILATANSYAGETNVTSGTLVVQDALSLGAADGTAATGTKVINGARLQIEGPLTIEDELLTSDDARVFSYGNNVWTGDMTDVGSDYLYLYAYDGSLQIDGDVDPFYLRVEYGNADGSVVFNGTSGTGIEPYYIWNRGELAINGTYSSYVWTYVQGNGVLTGTGTIDAGTAGSTYQLNIQSGGTVDPGTTSDPGILTTSDIIFEHTNSNFDVQLNGTTAGSGYDQLKVNGTVTLNGNLNVDLLPGFVNVNDTFTIIVNDDSDAVVGTFNGLSEGGLFSVSGDYFQISYEGGDGNDVTLTNVDVGVWDGGGADANWTTKENWEGDTAPVANAKLIFGAGALKLANYNDFATGTAFDGIAIVGSGYALSGNAIALNGAVSSSGTGNSLGMDLVLSSSGGIAHTASGAFTIGGGVDLDGNDLSLSSSGSGQIELNGSISDSSTTSTGDLNVSGNGSVILATANSYAGETNVTSGTLVVQDALSLGAADGTAATGTKVINGARLQIEGPLTIEDELLTSDDARVFSYGNNVWTGDMTDVGSDYLYLYAYDGSLQIDGDVDSYYLRVQYGNAAGSVVLNGTSGTGNEPFYVWNYGELAVNGNYSIYVYTYVQGTGC